MIIKLDMTRLSIPSEERILKAVRDAFESLGQGHAQQPAQTAVVLSGGEGDCIFYPGYVRSANAFGVKVSPYLESRKRRGEGPVTAFTLLVNSDTGLPELLVDALQLTTERTAATTLIGVQCIVSERHPKTIGIIGAGGIGRSHARYARHCFPHADIWIFSPSIARGDERGQERRRAIEAECPYAIAVDRLDPILSSEVIMLCTSSGTPVLDIDRTPTDCLISSVGTNLPDTHEIDWRRLAELRVFCDFRRTCPLTAGDMRLAVQSGSWSADRVILDIPEMLAGYDGSRTGGRSFLRATGLALEDIAVARLVSS